MTRSVTLMTLEDAPHFSAEDRAELIAKYPAHERDVRGRGIPMLGSGRIFPLSDGQVSCTAFQVPEFWPVLGALDFGYDHPTAAVRAAHDRDADIVYVTHCYRVKGETPIVHAEKCGASYFYIEGNELVFTVDVEGFHCERKEPLLEILLWDIEGHEEGRGGPIKDAEGITNLLALRAVLQGVVDRIDKQVEQ